MNLLFDLDGTLTDPFKGITTCIRYALKELNRPLPEARDLCWCIGPPLIQSFKTLLSCDDEKLPQKAVALYRKRFGKKGLYENEVYKNIPDVLKTLNHQGNTLFLATAKPTIYAEKIIIHFGLSTYFKTVYGSELDGTRTDKSHLISHILAEESIPPSEAIMIGDRRHDISGAKKNGLYSIGVLWGYGDRQELERAGSDLMVEEPVQLIDELQRLNANR